MHPTFDNTGLRTRWQPVEWMRTHYTPRNSQYWRVTQSHGHGPEQ